MKLLLIADTHVPTRARDLPSRVWDEVGRADVVLHAGDWVDVALLDVLEKRAARLVGCWGNNDGPELRARLPETVEFVTSPGHRVRAIVTDRAVLERLDPLGEFRLTGILDRGGAKDDLLRAAEEHLATAAAHADQNSQALDLFAEELRLAQDQLNSITGEFSSDDLLGVIFSRFCIGK